MPEKIVRHYINHLWFDKDLESAMSMCSKLVICNTFLGDAIGNANIIRLSKRLSNAFSDIKLQPDEFKKCDNNIIYTKGYHFGKHIRVFCGLNPTGKIIKSSWHAFYTVRDGIITKINSVSNLEVNLIKQGSRPYSNENEHEHLSTINAVCNSSLTNKEIFVASLWLSGYSIKESSTLLKLSRRTIEEYRSHIKIKLNLPNKKYLYDFSNNNRTLELFFNIANNLTN